MVPDITIYYQPLSLLIPTSVPWIKILPLAGIVGLIYLLCENEEE
jgi:hypothetical protein